MVSENKAFQRAVDETRRLTNEAVKELGAEATKLRAMAKEEFRDLMGEARSSGRQRFTQLGRELVKLGEKLEKLGRRPKAAPRRRAVRRPARSARTA